MKTNINNLSRVPYIATVMEIVPKLSGQMAGASGDNSCDNIN